MAGRRRPGGFFIASFYGDSRSCDVTINFQTTNADQQLALPGRLFLKRFLCQPDPAHPFYCCVFFLPQSAAHPHSLTGQARLREQALRMTKWRNSLFDQAQVASFRNGPCIIARMLWSLLK
jgi:hypothetical protein